MYTFILITLPFLHGRFRIDVPYCPLSSKAARQTPHAIRITEFGCAVHCQHCTGSTTHTCTRLHSRTRMQGVGTDTEVLTESIVHNLRVRAPFMTLCYTVRSTPNGRGRQTSRRRRSLLLPQRSRSSQVISYSIIKRVLYAYTKYHNSYRVRVHPLPREQSHVTVSNLLRSATVQIHERMI